MSSERPFRIVLSAGGDERELAASGLGMAHVNELMVRLSRRLLSADFCLAYGGTLGREGDELTSALIRSAEGWVDSSQKKPGLAIDVLDPETWPMRNYSAWPYSRSIEESYKASLVGICDFRPIEPPGADSERLSALGSSNAKTNPSARGLLADALTEMRRVSTEECDLRIIWGGKIRGADGWMAGLAEELDFSLKSGKPALVLGGFGGCARVIARYLADEGQADWPAPFTLEDARKAPGFDEMIGSAAPNLRERYSSLRRRLAGLRERLHTERKGTVAGISVEDMSAGLDAESPREAIHLAVKVAETLRGTR